MPSRPVSPRRDLRMISPDAPIEMALKLLEGPPPVGSVLVTVGIRLCGIITRRDLLLRTKAEWDPKSGLRARDVMTKDNLVTVHRGTTWEEATRILRLHRIEQLIVVTPDFDVVDVMSVNDPRRRKLTCFAVLPFVEPQLRVFEDHIRPILSKDFGIVASKADDIFRPGAIMETIHSLIRASSFLIADITDRNPNVYYEVGYGSAIGKPIIFIRTDREGHEAQIPFDVSYLPYFKYQYTPPGMRDFESKLRSVVRDLLETISTRE
jgi:CBS domain-containing protein